MAALHNIGSDPMISAQNTIYYFNVGFVKRKISQTGFQYHPSFDFHSFKTRLFSDQIVIRDSHDNYNSMQIYRGSGSLFLIAIYFRGVS